MVQVSAVKIHRSLKTIEFYGTWFYSRSNMTLFLTHSLSIRYFLLELSLYILSIFSSQFVFDVFKLALSIASLFYILKENKQTIVENIFSLSKITCLQYSFYPTVNIVDACIPPAGSKEQIRVLGFTIKIWELILLQLWNTIHKK